jgi:hypothetical protein
MRSKANANPSLRLNALFSNQVFAITRFRRTWLAAKWCGATEHWTIFTHD